MNSLTENHEPTSASPYSDEIDLFELIADLWKEKWIIISTTLIAGIIAVAYALLATPIYQSQAEVLPPYVSQITALNKGASAGGFSVISTDRAYAEFSRAIQSQELKRYFFENHYLPSLNDKEKEASLDSLKSSFNKMLSIQNDTKDASKRYRVTITHSNPEIAQVFANDYIVLTGDRAKEKLIESRQAEIDTILKNIELDITALTQKLELEKVEELKRLNDALKIATELGISSPMTPEGMTATEGAVYVDRNLMYLRGSKALKAQIEVLDKREIDVLSLPEGRNLKAKQDLLNQLSIDEDKISLYNLDAPAELPEKPIKPKKKLVVLIGGLVGFMLGGMIALVRIAMRNRKQTGLN